MLNYRHALLIAVLKNIFCRDFTDDDLTSGLPLKYEKLDEADDFGYLYIRNLMNLNDSNSPDYLEPDEIPFYEPLTYAGLARVDLLNPAGINFSVTDNIDWLDEMILHANINIRDMNRSQIIGTFKKYSYDFYYLWEYINKEIVLNPGDTFYYWINLTTKISTVYSVPVKQFTVKNDGKLQSPPINWTLEQFRIFSV